MQVSVKKSGNPESAVLVGMIRQGQDEETVLENLNELKFLAYTANAETKWLVTQRMEAPNPKTFIGAGKIMEVKNYVKEKKIDLVIFDDELSPTQLRNIEKIINGSIENASCKILDRTNLILDIFASRARTAHAKSQVELAQYQYLLPRLTRMWTHLERQKGGIGLRGPGETELETDRRIIREKISRLKKKIVIIDKQKAIQRKHRAAMIRVALVGYTNVGKSTLMNLLSKSDVFAENKLFATLDTTIRKVVIDNLPFLLSDTVGFIRKLPHQLIESFKSTLDEVKDADMLIHIVDISQSNFESQIEIVNDTLKEIGAIDKPTIMIFNKIDLYKDKDHPVNLSAFQKSWMSRINDSSLFISATKKKNITALKSLFYNEIKKLHSQRYPYDNFLY
ncbi:MAG TPA: GTPase HflX [Flavobacteriales bacterium]|nr:GTPase HflX [Flavobacteriales bacterium]HIA13185.1 GTPase HflX [Flavobacteriales bacterium]HIO71539.1 GTPase HflX [Flavobacteriales bacterium]